MDDPDEYVDSVPGEEGGETGSCGRTGLAVAKEIVVDLNPPGGPFVLLVRNNISSLSLISAHLYEVSVRLCRCSEETLP